VTLKPVDLFGPAPAAWIALMTPSPAAITKITAY
jgi:hypothetical protein